MKRSRRQSIEDITEKEKQDLIKRRKHCALVEGCDSIQNYIHLNKIHEGVYGIVFRAQDKITNEIFAIKKIKLNKGNKLYF